MMVVVCNVCRRKRGRSTIVTIDVPSNVMMVVIIIFRIWDWNFIYFIWEMSVKLKRYFQNNKEEIVQLDKKEGGREWWTESTWHNFSILNAWLYSCHIFFINTSYFNYTKVVKLYSLLHYILDSFFVTFLFLTFIY